MKSCCVIGHRDGTAIAYNYALKKSKNIINLYKN